MRLDVGGGHVQCDLGTRCPDCLAVLGRQLEKFRTPGLAQHLPATALQHDQVEGLVDVQPAGLEQLCDRMLVEGRAADRRRFENEIRGVAVPL